MQSVMWDVTARQQQNRLMRSESVPGHCGHLPCRMTSSGCLSVVHNPSLDFEETPGSQTSHLHRERCSQQAWLSHVNITQMFLQIQGLESRKPNSSVRAEQQQKRNNVIVHLELFCILSTGLSIPTPFLIQVVTLGS